MQKLYTENVILNLSYFAKIIKRHKKIYIL